MTIRLSAPSKTFLTGEYAVLAGAPALIINTQPRFELVAQKVGLVRDEAILGIPPDSPADRWLKQREPLLQGWSLDFKDPHKGRGGFGASSAQFLLVHAFTTYLQRSFEHWDEDAGDLWNDYQTLTKFSGSGADVLAQLSGGIARTELKPVETEAEDWPYPEIGFMILRTGKKVATHEHLRSVDRSKLTPLLPMAVSCYEAFDTEPSETFLSHVARYAKTLRELELQAPETLKMLSKFEAEEWCLVSKGCGAYGADTGIVFYPSESRREVMQFARTQGVEIAATETDLSSGLEVHREAN
jgi:mevalonate kinase